MKIGMKILKYLNFNQTLKFGNPFLSANYDVSSRCCFEETLHCQLHIYIFLSFLSIEGVSKDKRKELKPFKVNKKVEKKGDFIIIRTETVFTKSQWKQLKNQAKENRSFLKNIKKKEITSNEKNPS